VPRLLWVLMFAGCAAGAPGRARAVNIAPAPGDTSLYIAPAPSPRPLARWFFAAGGGTVIGVNQLFGSNGPGGCVWLEAGRRSSAWLALGVDGGWIDFGATEGDAWGVLVTSGSTTTTALAMLGSCRLSFPTYPGLSPYAIAEYGLIRSRSGGDPQREGTASASPANPVRFDEASCEALGVGLRGLWPRPAPGFEASIRLIFVPGSAEERILQPRLSLTW